jgi:hypothetical protein
MPVMNTPFAIIGEMNWLRRGLPAWVPCSAAFVIHIKDVEDAEVSAVAKYFADVFGM